MVAVWEKEKYRVVVVEAAEILEAWVETREEME